MVELAFNFDRQDRILVRFITLCLSAIIGGTILYYQIIPYGPHDEIIKVSLIVGLVIGILIQVAIHSLSRKWRLNHV